MIHISPEDSLPDPEAYINFIANCTIEKSTNSEDLRGVV